MTLYNKTKWPLALGAPKSTNQGQMIIVADAAGPAFVDILLFLYANSQMNLIKRLKLTFGAPGGLQRCFLHH